MHGGIYKVGHLSVGHVRIREWHDLWLLRGEEKMVQRTVWNTIEAAIGLGCYDEMEKILEDETDEPKVKKTRPKGLFSQPA